MKKPVRIILVILVLLVLVVVCLPWICSTGFVKAKILGIANNKIDGSVSINAWSLRWTREISLRGIEFEDSESGTRVKVDEVRTDRGLLGFLLNRKDLGAIYVDAPFVTASVPEEEPGVPVESSPAETPAAEGGAKPPESMPGAPRDKPVALPDVAIRLVVTNGTFALANAGREPETVATDVHVTAVLEGAESPVAVVAGITSADGQGHLHLDASAQADSSGDFARPRILANIEADDLDLEPLTTFAMQFAEVPVVNGILNAKINVDGAATEEFRLSGVVSVPDLQLSGGPFSSDTPSLGDVALSVEGLVGSNSIRIERLNLESEVARVSAAGELRIDEDSQLKVDGNVDLTKLLAQFPATLGVRDGLRIEEGSIELGADISTSGEGLSLSATASLPVLRGTVATESVKADISWDRPTALKFQGQKNAEGITIQTLHFDAPFASVSGKGDLNHLDVSISAELGELREEIGKLVELDPWQLAGKLMVSAKLDRPDDGSTASVLCDVTLDDAEIAHGPEILMPRGSWVVRIASGISTNRDGVQFTLLNPSLSWKLPLGQGKVAAQSMAVPRDCGGEPEIIGGTLEAGFDLDRVLTVLNAIEAAPDGLSLRGDSRLNIAYSLKGRNVEVGQSVVSFQRLFVKQDDRILEQEFVNLAFNADADLDRQSVRVPEGTLTIPGAKLHIRDLVLDKSRPEDIAAVLTGDIDIEKLTSGIASFVAIPPETSVAGQAAFEVQVKGSPSGEDTPGVMGNAEINLTGLVFRQDEKTLRDAEMGFSVDEFRAVPGRLFVVNGAKLKSTMGEIVVSAIEIPIDRPASATASLQASLGLKSVQDVLQEFLALPDSTSMDGSASVRLDIAEAPTGGRMITMDAEVSEFDLVSEGQAVLENDGASVKARIVAGEPLGQFIVIEELSMQSRPLQLTATGKLQAGAADRSVEVNGKVGVDLEAAETYIRNLAGLDIVLRGKGNEPFSFQSTWSPMSGESVLTRANLQAALRADEIKAFGFDLKAVQLPVSIASGLFKGELRADINQGKLEVLPEVDFSRENRTLTLRNPTNLISNVELTQEIADGLLGRIHPLFKGASVIGGRFDLSMDNFSWPLEADRRNKAVFEGVMKFHDLRLGASGLLEKLLTAMKVKEQSVEVGERNIEFNCENGRISTSPTHFKVDGNEVTLSGTVGLDETLDYVAQVPVTEELVGSSAFEYLEDTTINVPIRGTISRPTLNAAVLTEAAADLAKQAAQKEIKKKTGEFLEREGGKLFDRLLK
jgi:hypothetical protein